MATSIGTLVIDLVAGTARLDKDFKKARSHTDKFKTDLVKLGKVAGTAAVVGFAAFSTAAIKAAADAAETTAKFETVFGTATDEMNDFISNLKTTVPATKKELEDMSSGLQDLLVPIGIIPSEATKMNKAFINLAADLSSFNNVPMAQTLDAIRSGLVGSSEPLQRYGIDTRVAALEAKALSLGLIEEGEKLDNASRAMAVLAQATDQSTFAIGDAARTATSTANQMKFLTRDIKELTETAGNAMLPTFSTVLRMLVDVTSGAQESGGAMTFLAEAVAFPVMAFFRLAEGIQRLVVIPLLKLQKVIAETLRFFATFGKFLGNDTQPRIDELSLRILQIDDNMEGAKGAAAAWASKQADLTDAINQFKNPIKNATKEVEGFKVEADLTEPVVVDLAAGVADFTKETEDSRKKVNEMVGILPLFKGGMDALKRSTSEAKQAAVDFAREHNLISTTIDSTWVPKLDILKERYQKDGGLIGLLDDGTAAAEEHKKEFEKLTKAQGDNITKTNEWAELWSRQVSTIVTDFSKGVADIIFEGGNLKDTLVGIFKNLGKTLVRTLVEGFFTPILKRFTDLIGGLAGGVLGGVLGGAGSGAAGGLASGLASGLTGFLTGGLSNILGGVIGGFISLIGNKDKEIAFNTRLTLAWIEDFFPEFTRWFSLMAASLNDINANLIGARFQLDGVIIQSQGINTGLGFANSILADRIAAAVESIDRKTPVEINLTTSTTVKVDGQVTGPLPPMAATRIGTDIGKQIIKEVKRGIDTNQGGLRTAIQKVV